MGLAGAGFFAFATGRAVAFLALLFFVLTSRKIYVFIPKTKEILSLPKFRVGECSKGK
jgi:hypothetical protein